MAEIDWFLFAEKIREVHSDYFMSHPEELIRDAGLLSESYDAPVPVALAAVILAAERVSGRGRQNVDLNATQSVETVKIAFIMTDLSGVKHTFLEDAVVRVEVDFGNTKFVNLSGIKFIAPCEGDVTIAVRRKMDGRVVEFPIPHMTLYLRKNDSLEIGSLEIGPE